MSFYRIFKILGSGKISLHLGAPDFHGANLPSSGKLQVIFKTYKPLLKSHQTKYYLRTKTDELLIRVRTG